MADLQRALTLAPRTPHDHFIAADAFTYGFPDPAQAFTHAQLALDGGLDTPRVHAILASSYLAFGNVAAAAAHLERHLDLVTTDLVPGAPLVTRDSIDVALVPGRTVEIPVPAIAGEKVSITTTSNDYWDSIAVLLAPDGTPVTGSDDGKSYFAAFDWSALQTAIYRLRVTFFESVHSGTLRVTRK